MSQYSQPPDLSLLCPGDSCHVFPSTVAPTYAYTAESDEVVLNGHPSLVPPTTLASHEATLNIGVNKKGKITNKEGSDDNSGNDATVNSLDDLQQAAGRRWLLPAEILQLLTKWDDIGLRESTSPPRYPKNGDIFLFDKMRTKNFRDDGVKWVMKKGTVSQRVREDFVKFTSTNGQIVLTGFYTYSSDDTSFKRRCYKKAIEGCTQYFVHYRKYSEDENHRARRKEKSKKVSTRKVKNTSAINIHNVNVDEIYCFDGNETRNSQTSPIQQISHLRGYNDDNDDKKAFELQITPGIDLEESRDLNDDDLNSLLQGWSYDMGSNVRSEKSASNECTHYSEFPLSSPSRCISQSMNVLDAQRRRQLQIASYIEIVPTSSTICGDMKVLIVLSTPSQDFLPYQCNVYFTSKDFIGYSIGSRLNEAVVSVRTPKVGIPGRYSIHLESISGDLIAPRCVDIFEILPEEKKSCITPLLNLINSSDLNICLSYNVNAGSPSSKEIKRQLPSLFPENFPVSASSFVPTSPDRGLILGKRGCDNEKQNKIRIVEKLGSVVSQHTGDLSGNCDLWVPSGLNGSSSYVKSTQETTGDSEFDSIEWLDDTLLNDLSTIDLEKKSEIIIQAVMHDLVNVADSHDLQSTFNSHDSLGFNVLHYCCMYELNDLISPLLEKGAFIDDKSSSGSGSTALHLACCVGNKKAVEILLDKGADVTILDSNAKSPSQIALNLGYAEIYKLFKDEILDNGDCADDSFMYVDGSSHFGVTSTSSPQPIIDIGSSSVLNSNKLLQEAFDSLSIKDKCALSISFGHNQHILKELSENMDIEKHHSSSSKQTASNTDDFEIQSVLSDLSENDKGAFDSIIHLMGPQELENVKAEVKLIQNNVRGWLLRKNYVNLREATKTLQVAWRERKKQFEKDCMDEGDEHQHKDIFDSRPNDGRSCSFIRSLKIDLEKKKIPLSSFPSSIGSFNSLKIKPRTTSAITAIQAATRGMLARKAFDELNRKALSTLILQRSLINRTDKGAFSRNLKDHHDNLDDYSTN